MKMKRTTTFAQVSPGTYQAILHNLDAKTITTAEGPTDIVEWVFRISDGDHEGDMVSGSTSQAWSEKSKAFAWAKSLNGNKPWDGVDADGDPDIAGLVGLACFVEVKEKVSANGTARTKVEAVLPDLSAKKAAQKIPF
jgi:hypothetical protein